MLLNRIKEYEYRNIAAKIRDEHQKSKKIVTLNGCFDILHPGHIFMLKEAKKQGDVLVVALNSDEYISKFKGCKRPYFSLEDRISIMESLCYVDYVTFFEEATPCEFIECIKPNVHVNGEEYKENSIEKKVVEKYGGRLHFVPRIEKYSTTKTIHMMDL